MSPQLRPTGRTASAQFSLRPRTVAHRATPPAIAALAAAALLALSGCGPDPQFQETAPSASAESSATSSTPDTATGTPGNEAPESAAATPSDPEPATATATEERMTELLQLHARLKTELGAAYSDAWIEDNQLHVAVTTPEAEALVYGAGAVPFRTEFTEQQLREAADAFKAWLATDAAPSVQLHWLETSGRTGSITVRVPAEQVQSLADAVAQQSPAGPVKIIVEESSGPATPLATNAP